MTLVLMAKAFKLIYSTPTNNNQRTSSNPHNRQIAQPGIANQNVNQTGNGNVVATQSEFNGNHIRCYNCRGLGHYVMNCIVRPMRRDAAYLQTKLLIAQKEEAGIQLQAEKFDLMTSRKDKFMPINQVRASVRTNPITVSQPHVITKKDVNSDLHGLSSIGVDNTAKTRRPRPRSYTKNDRVIFASKSSCIKNKDVEVKEHQRNLLISKNKKHMSSECNNIKLAILCDKFKIVSALCKQCLITSNHIVCVLSYVNDMNSRADIHSANV
nr:hypothetical protein [Tanacetum cinerariifolium]